LLQGIAIGSGAILPGISSGVLCVIFGIYETLLDCVLNFFKNFKQNFKVLFPIALGAFIGIIIFGKILKYLFFAYPVQIKFIFIGLIIGCIPSLFKEVKSKASIKPYYFLFTLIAFFIGILLVILEKNITNNIFVANYNILLLIFVGFITSAGVVIPGVSSTLILMLFGIYEKYLDAISYIYLPFLIPLGVGLILGCFVFMKLTKFLLNKFYPQTFFTIIGFTLGSIFVLYPGFSFDITGVISILSLFLGLTLSQIIG
jgi:putative membrane protein